MQKKWTMLLKRRTAAQRLQFAPSTGIHQPSRHSKTTQALSAYSRHEGAKGKGPSKWTSLGAKESLRLPPTQSRDPLEVRRLA